MRQIVDIILLLTLTTACAGSTRETPAGPGQRSGTVALIGTSYDDAGIDVAALGAALGYRIERFATEGTRPAWCYAVLSLQILRGDIPDCCVITGDMGAITLPDTNLTDDWPADPEHEAGFSAVMDTIGVVLAGARRSPPPGDFNALAESSFLPRILDLARRYRIVPVFADVRMLADVENPLAENVQEQRGRDQLAAYLEKNGAIFLEYCRDPEIEAADFRDAGHLNARGRRKWTAQLRLDLGNIRDGKPALHEYHVRPGTVRITRPVAGARLNAGQDIVLSAEGDRIVKWSCFVPGGPDGETFLGTGRHVTARIAPIDHQEHTAYIFAYDGYSKDQVACVLVSSGAENLPPRVNGGEDLVSVVGRRTIVRAVAADDGHPAPVLKYRWELLQGSALLGPTDAESLVVTPDSAGLICLSVGVSDGEYTRTDNVCIRMPPDSTSTPSDSR